MADLEENNPGFEITTSLNGENKTITIQPDETSDGVEYYIGLMGKDQITQIRLDEDGNWEQLWGDLSPDEVDEIGEAIKQKQF